MFGPDEEGQALVRAEPEIAVIVFQDPADHAIRKAILLPVAGEGVRPAVEFVQSAAGGPDHSTPDRPPGWNTPFYDSNCGDRRYHADSGENYPFPGYTVQAFLRTDPEYALAVLIQAFDVVVAQARGIGGSCR